MSMVSGNELFTRDRMERDNADFDGSGKGNGFYDENRDFRQRLFDAKLPLILTVIMICLFLLTVYLHVKDLMLYVNGNAVTVDLTDPQNYVGRDAVLADSKGVKHYIKLTEKEAAKGQVTLYYYGDDVIHAQTKDAGLFYFFMYAVWGILAAVCAIWTYKVVHVTNYSQGAVSSGKFDD